jgi:hypothetical protein
MKLIRTARKYRDIFEFFLAFLPFPQKQKISVIPRFSLKLAYRQDNKSRKQLTDIKREQMISSKIFTINHWDYHNFGHSLSAESAEKFIKSARKIRHPTLLP